MQAHYDRPVSYEAALSAAVLACRPPVNTFDPRVLIALLGDDVVGSIVMNVTFPAFELSLSLHIRDLYVSNSLRRSGIGRLLVKSAHASPSTKASQRWSGRRTRQLGSPRDDEICGPSNSIGPIIGCLTIRSEPRRSSSSEPGGRDFSSAAFYPQCGAQIAVPCAGAFGPTATYPVWQYRLNQQAFAPGLVFRCDRHERHVAWSMAVAAIGRSDIAGNAIRRLSIQSVPDTTFQPAYPVAEQRAQVGRQRFPCRGIGAKERQPPTDGHRVDVGCHIRKAHFIAAQCAGYGAINHTGWVAFTISANGTRAGIAPNSVIISDCPTDEIRMRRPDRSLRPVKGFVQKRTCAGYV